MSGLCPGAAVSSIMQHKGEGGITGRIKSERGGVEPPLPHFSHKRRYLSINRGSAVSRVQKINGGSILLSQSQIRPLRLRLAEKDKRHIYQVRLSVAITLDNC